MQSIGRYLLFGEIASGGMATVHLGRLSGPAGFSRTVAIKRLHATYAKDSEFVAMFLDEAKLAARIRHPNVIPTLDVVATEAEVFLVMEYVQGESLAKLRRATAGLGKATDPRVVASLMSGVLHGLHAAHEATDEQGDSLGIVHRDVSPQNILVGVDGAARLLDFGVAKALGRAQTTQSGHIKGKLAYMPPEQLSGGVITRRADIYAAAVVTWEALTGKRLFQGDHQAAVIAAVFQKRVPLPSSVAPHISRAFDRVVMRGLEREPTLRYSTAREMAIELERCAGVASSTEVGNWVESLAAGDLMKRAALVSEVESASTLDAPILLGPGGDSRIPTPPESNTSSPPWAASRVSAKEAIVVDGTSRRRAVLWAARVGIPLLVLLFFATIRNNFDSKPDPGSESAAARASESIKALPAPVSPVISADPPALTALRPDPPAADPAPAPVAAPAPQAPAAPVVARVAVPRSYPRPVTTRNECDPPFTIDEKGHKHYKAACLP